MTGVRIWRDVEKAQDATWNRAVDRIFEGRSSYPGLCPVCGRAEIRYFFGRAGEDHSSPRGSLWTWCPVCLRYSHYSAAVPEWWVNLPGVPYDELSADPEWLEEHWDQLLAAGHPQAKAASPSSE